MPAWISPLGIYAAWAAATTVGFTGYVLLRRRHERAGYALVITLAPLSAHALATNVTRLEAIAAATLLIAVSLKTR